jgi:hypothetical protein
MEEKKIYDLVLYSATIYLSLEMYERAYRKFDELMKKVRLRSPMLLSAGSLNLTLCAAFYLLMTKLMGNKMQKECDIEALMEAISNSGMANIDQKKLMLMENLRAFAKGAEHNKQLIGEYVVQ